MICGSPALVADTRALLNGRGFSEGNHGEPALFVVERRSPSADQIALDPHTANDLKENASKRSQSARGQGGGGRTDKVSSKTKSDG